VKGKAEPVLAYRALARRAAGRRVRGIEGLHAEMVGREAELRALRGVLADLRQGVGRIVCVLGEAGLGKSRLVAEAAHSFGHLAGPSGQWYETASLSYETSQAYGLFQRLRRRLKRLRGSAAAVQASAGAGRSLRARRERAPHLWALFGLDRNGCPWKAGL
jgi:hypothetical protein